MINETITWVERDVMQVVLESNNTNPPLITNATIHMHKKIEIDPSIIRTHSKRPKDSKIKKQVQSHPIITKIVMPCNIKYSAAFH